MSRAVTIRTINRSKYGMPRHAHLPERGDAGLQPCSFATAVCALVVRARILGSKVRTYIHMSRCHIATPIGLKERYLASEYVGT